MITRGSGILLHIANLASNFGIGHLGNPSKKFIDFLHKSHQKYWQILPTVPTGYGDSPYQSCSSEAGNEYFIDLEDLFSNGLLTKEELDTCKTSVDSRINYENLFQTRFNILKIAFSRFNKSDKEFCDFVNKGDYSEYALFRSIKTAHNHKPWNEWSNEYKFRNQKALEDFKKNNENDILFWQWCQYVYAKQWKELLEYAHAHDVKIIGDIPIYVAYDSVECWTMPKLFKLDQDLNPIVVAGCPPDCFSQTGQLWGNPIYNWNEMAKDNYSWWKERFKKNFELFDIIRIDHFRGFDRYYQIKWGEPNAINGSWESAPSEELFVEIERDLGELNVIAEDLGILDDSARKMFANLGYPGMKILQFAFDYNSANEYRPHNYNNDNCIVYPGTHDNDTLLGYIQELPNRNDFVNAVRNELFIMGMDLPLDSDAEICDAIIALAFASKARLAIISMQDWLKIDNRGRINLPSTLSISNWSYRIPENYSTDYVINKIKYLTIKYNR